ncbi:MAG: hypothetical protein WD232_06090 [Acidimicrobiales bacterium]
MRRWRARGGVLLATALMMVACGGATEHTALQRLGGPAPMIDALVSQDEPAPVPAAPDDTAPSEPPPVAAPPASEPPSEPAAPAALAASHRSVAVYSGLGAWIDVYDWSHTFGKDGPLVEVADIDRMADLGVQTLYVQSSKWDAPQHVLEPERLVPLIQRARARGLGVVAWYLPTLEDPAFDLARLLTIAQLPIDTIAVDIESLKVKDHAERNRRLVALSTELRAARPDLTLGAIPYPPVLLEVVNPNLWPGFPWAELAPLYDVWLPMSYQSDRKQSSGYRDAERYTAESIDRMRANLGRPDAPVHTIGGIANRTSPGDVEGMLRASVLRQVLGGSLYDYRTTTDDLWPALQAFRAQGR